MEHEVEITEQEHSYDLTCSCTWTYSASKATPGKSKIHPEGREADCFAVASAERHLISKGVWPYTSHGKPERFNEETQKVEVIEDWPFNK